MNTKAIAHICYYLQLHRLAYFINRKRKRVITFHNVLDDDIFIRNVANGVSNSFSSFKKIIDEIGNRFPFSLDLNDSDTVTITFDDGYNNQVAVAAPYLIQKGIPAYLFVSGQLISDRGATDTALTIDKLLHWVSYVPAGDYTLKVLNREVSFSIGENNRDSIWGDIFWPLYLEDTAKGINLFNACDAVYSWSDLISTLDKKYVSQRLQGVNIAQLEELIRKGWQIGWHTASHFPIAKLTQKEKEAELTPPSCQGVNYQYVNSNVISLPYGGPYDVDNEAIRIIQKLGFDAALSNVNIANDFSGKWYRARMALSDDKALLHFELSGLKHMLKYRKLLPVI